MPVPKVQSMLLPILKHIGERRSVETIRERLKEQFQITPPEADMTHESGQNVYVNRVAWALAHLMMGGLIRKTGVTDGNYEITDNGISRLNENPDELTIQDLH